MTTRAGDSRRRDLLLAIFGEDADSLMAWGRWQRQTDIESLSRSEFGLQPALSRRLELHGITHPWLARLRGVHRYCWTANQLTRRDVLTVFAALEQAAVDAAAPGGLPLIARLYDDLAGRPADHVDVLVLPEAMAAAQATLASLGWAPRTPLPPAELHSVSGPVTFARVGHRHVVLHWHCAPAPVSDRTNHAMFSRRNAVPFGTGQVPMLDDVDLLVLTCVHHRRFAPHDTLLWAADAVLLLRQLDATSRQSQIWERAAALGVGRRLAECIAEVHALVGDRLPFIPSVPASIAYDDDPIVGILLDTPAGGAGMRRAVSRARTRYEAWSTSVGAPRSFRGFVRFSVSQYRYAWNVPLWKLPLASIRRLYGTPAGTTTVDDHVASVSGAAPSVIA